MTEEFVSEVEKKKFIGNSCLISGINIGIVTMKACLVWCVRLIVSLYNAQVCLYMSMYLYLSIKMV